MSETNDFERVVMHEMTISMQTFEDENGQFGVQVIVSGLETNEQADRAMDYLQKTLCGKEQTVN